MSGDIISIDVPPNESVGYLKQQLKSMFYDIPIDRVQLFSDVEMYPDTMPITHYNLDNMLMILIKPPPLIIECFDMEEHEFVDMYKIDKMVPYLLNRTENSLIIKSISKTQSYILLNSKHPLPSDCISYFTIETNGEGIQLEIGSLGLEWCTHHNLKQEILNRKLKYPKFGDCFFQMSYTNYTDKIKILAMYNPTNNTIKIFDGPYMKTYDIYHCKLCNLKNYIKLSLIRNMNKEHITVVRESTREEMERFV
jgi:hypothetical protein